MTKLEKFIDFASKQNAETLALIEAQLDRIMQNHQSDDILSAEQEEQVLSILANSNRTFADPERVNAIFGKPV